MENSHTGTSLPGRVEAEIFDSLGEEDSIVDRLLDLPTPEAAPGADPVGSGVARRLEKVLADKMRERIDGQK